MPHKDERDWVRIAAVLAAGLLALSAISFVAMPFLPWFEQRQAGEEILRDEMDAEQALEDYREFRQLYHDIQAQRAIVENSYEEEEQFHETYGDDPSEWSRTAEERHGRIHTRITGNKNQLEQLVAEYNAKSDDVTADIWKCNLPYQVDDRFAIAGPPGSDAPEEPVDTGPDGDPVTPDAEVPPPSECDGLPDEMQQGSSALAPMTQPPLASIAAEPAGGTPT